MRFLQPKSGSGGDAISTTAGASAPPPVARVSARPAKVFGPRPDGCTTVYVGNLAYDITEEVLRKVFAKCGTVKAVRFAEHIQTGEFRGFGYVQFYDEAPCEQAVTLDGMIVMGRPMNIDYGSRDEESAKARDELARKLKKGVCNKFQSGQCDRGDACKFAHVRTDQDAEELVRPAERPVGAAVAAAAEAVVVPTASSDAPVCINFQKGKCKRGDACKFQHLGANVGDPTAVTEGARPTPVRVPQASDVDAEQPLMTQAGEEDETGADADAPVCQNFQKGKCKRGTACRFRHVAAALDASSGQSQSGGRAFVAPVRVERPAAIVADVAVCQNFRRGRCTRGASCRFAHTEGATMATAKATADADVVEEVSYYQKRFQSVCYNWQKSGSCVRGDGCSFQHEGGPSAAFPAVSPGVGVEANGEDGGEGGGEETTVKAKKTSKKRKVAPEDVEDVEDDDDDDKKAKKQAKKEKKEMKKTKKTKKAKKASRHED